MKTKLPTALVECIDKHIKDEVAFSQLKEKQIQLLNKKFINLWYFIFSSQIDDNNKTLKYYTNIHYTYLTPFKFKLKKKVYQYNELLNFLNNWNLIEINHKYCSKNQNKGCGSFSKSYRIRTEFLHGTQMSDVEIDFTKIFKDNKNKEYWLKKYPEYSNLIEDSYNTTIKLDEFICRLYKKKGMELKSKMIGGVLTKRYLTPERILMYVNKALKLHFKNLWFTVSNEGRFYSSITNLPSVAIDFLRLYKKKVVELDVKNCQPLLLASLINDHNYQNDAENGVFYERIANILGCKEKIFKLMSYKYIFFIKNPLKKGKILDAMNSCYPELIEQINNLIKDNNLALALQRMESSIFIDKIGKIPNSKITRHDSVLVAKNDSKLFKKLIRNEFHKIGLKVSIEVNEKQKITLLD